MFVSYCNFSNSGLINCENGVHFSKVLKKLMYCLDSVMYLLIASLLSIAELHYSSASLKARLWPSSVC